MYWVLCCLNCVLGPMLSCLCTGYYAVLFVYWVLCCLVFVLGTMLSCLYTGSYVVLFVYWVLCCLVCVLGTMLSCLYTGYYVVLLNLERDLTRLPSQTTSSRWQVDKEAIGLLRVQQFSHLCAARPYQISVNSIFKHIHTTSINIIIWQFVPFIYHPL